MEEDLILLELQKISSLLEGLNFLQSDFYTNILVWSHFIFSVVIPLVLILLFGWWFFKQFLYRW
jgi:hypothetical protein